MLTLTLILNDDTIARIRQVKPQQSIDSYIADALSLKLDCDLTINKALEEYKNNHKKS